MTPETRSGKSRKIGWSLLAALFSLVFWAGLFEAGARLWLSRRGDPLDRASAVLQADSALGWRQKSRFEGDFLGLPLRTNETGFRTHPASKMEQAQRRILVLGPSSTFGWGVLQEEAYPAVLEDLIGATRTEVPTTVFNAGQIGYSSWQGLKLFRSELNRLKPDVIVIAYGVNDVDLHRFFFDSSAPDKVELAVPKSTPSIRAGNLLARLAFLRMSTRWAGRTIHGFSCAEPAAPSLRVALSDLEKNLEELSRAGLRSGAQVILLTTPWELPALPEPRPGALLAARRFLESGKEHLAANDAERAAADFRASLDADPHQDETGYLLSAAYARMGECARSRAVFQDARTAGPRRITRDIHKVNAAVKRVARRMALPVSDAASYLQALNAETRAFVDPIHPSAAGHRAIAADLARLIRKPRPAVHKG